MTKTIAVIEGNEALCSSLTNELLHAGFNVQRILAPSKLYDKAAGDTFLAVLWGGLSKDVLDEISKVQDNLPVIPIVEKEEPSLCGALLEKGISCYLQRNECNEDTLRFAIRTAINQKWHEKQKELSSPIDYEGLFQDCPVPMWIYDRETLKFLIVNNEAIRKYGYSRDEFLSTTIKHIRPEEDIPTLVEDISFSLNKFVWRHRKKDGQVFHTHVQSVNGSIGDRSVTLITATDIDDKIKAEEQNLKLLETVSEQKENLDEILSSMGEVVWKTRADTFQLLYTNDASFRVYGYRPEEMMADPTIFFNCIHPEDRELFNKSMEEVLSTGKTESQFRIYHKDGSLKYLKGNAILKKGKNGNPDTLSGLSIDITDLIQAQQALNRKVKQVENILESIADGFFSVDKDWKLTYVNKAFERIFRADRHTVIGKVLWDSFPMIKQSVFASKLMEAVNEQKTVQSTGYSITSDKWLSLKIYPTKSGLTGYISDVTEERKLQEQMIVAEKKLRAIINNTQDLIWSVDKDLNVLEANEAFWKKVMEITGVKKTKIGEMGLPDEVFKEWQQLYRRAFQGETFKIVYETVINQTPVHEEISFNPIFSKDNTILGICCFSRDITEERALHEKIIASEGRMRALIDNTNDLIWSIDRDLNLTAFNRPYEEICVKITGQSPKIGTISPLLNLEYLRSFKENYYRALEGKPHVIVQKYKIGEESRYGETRFHPIYDSNKKVIGVSCLTRDITEHRNYLLKIENQNKQLTEIAWIQSHKVRSQVVSILGLAQVLDPEKPYDDVNREIIGSMITAANLLDGVIREINDKTKALKN